MQRHLDGHERRKRQRAEPSPCRGVGPRGSQRRQNPNRQRHKDDEDDSEREHAGVEPDLAGRGSTVGVMSRSAGNSAP